MAEELDEAEGPRLSGTQKSAILMMLLGEEEAAEVLKNLSPKKSSMWELRCIQCKLPIREL